MIQPEFSQDQSHDSFALDVKGLSVMISGNEILCSASLGVKMGEILGIVGASGCGKSVFLRAVLGLIPYSAQSIRVFGQDVTNAQVPNFKLFSRQWGVLFQRGALISSLTALQNIILPIKEHLKLSRQDLNDIALLNLKLVGLSADTAHKYPHELSGGMTKRVALARSLALGPDVVFLDEPTAGLDPLSAHDFDELILRLRKALGITVVMVTHDIDSLRYICDRIAVIARKRVLTTTTFSALRTYDDPWVMRYFNSARAKKSV